MSNAPSASEESTPAQAGPSAAPAGRGDRPTGARAALIRLIVSPIILGIVAGVLYLQHTTGNALATDFLLALVTAGAGVEMAMLLGARVPGLSRLHAGAFCALLCLVGAFAPGGGTADVFVRFELRLGILTAALFTLLARHARDTRPQAVEQIAVAMIPVIYVGLLASVLREFAVGPEGALRLLFIVLVAKSSDIGGWLIGKPFGKHKMIPSVSPGKSWEGTAGGLALSALAAVFLPELLQIGEAAWSMAHRLGFGIVLGGASILAGITQSGWKRRVRVKDSSALIPEMGGFLDMLDSLLVAGPVAWLWYRLLGG